MSLSCPKCGDPYEAGGLEEAEAGAAVSATVGCPSCGAEVETTLFPVLARPAPRIDFAGAGEGATCFFCEGRAAVAVCEGCGRLICERCRIDWAGETTCLTCVHANREVRDADRYRSRRVLYDNLALSLLLWPLAIPIYGFFGLALTAPAALFLVIRHGKKSRGIVPRNRFRLVLSGVLSVLAIVGMVVGMIALAML